VSVVLLLIFGEVSIRRVQADDLFRDRVVPIIQHRCLSCHNSVDHKGGFALQTAEELTKSGFVERNQPHNSHLLSVLKPQAGKRPAMPKNGDPLKPDQVAAFEQWIADGARWPEGFRIEEPVVTSTDWWSFQPLARPAVPTLNSQLSTLNSQNPIDAFIIAKQREHGLSLSAEADRRTLIRRLTYDLIGLPPTPEEVDEFINDPDPTAYERLVDRLLASPHYGERWGRHWLDVARYADTCGYDKDKLRPNAWPYRDYVIRSFNEDKPYARFVEEQIAGDVLYPGTPDGILGLGFIAAGPWDFIGHVEVPETKIDGKIARHNDRDEMVTATLNTFCSVTIQCAQCHNHKFDPFTQQHYYGLQAVFAAVDRAERVYDLDPSIEQQRRELTAKQHDLQAKIRELDSEIRTAGGDELARLEKEIREQTPKAQPFAKKAEYGYHSAIESSPDQEKWVQIDLGQVVEIDRVVLHACHDEFGGIGAGFGFPLRYRIDVAESADQLARSASQGAKTADNGNSSRTLRVTLADDTQADIPNPGLVPVTINARGTKARFVRITVPKLRERTNDFHFALAEVEVLTADGQNVALHAEVTARDSIEAPIRWAKKNLTDGIWPQAADTAAITQLAELHKQLHAVLNRLHTPERNTRRQELESGLKFTQQQLVALPKGRLVLAAATDFEPQGGFQPTKGKPRDVQVLHRGNVLQPRGTAVPGALPIVKNVPAEFSLDPDHREGDRRAALAKWITRPDHPTTWRSIANRVWQFHFGQPIVESPNDFGRMGRLPSHPELLDWLAAEFVESRETRVESKAETSAVPSRLSSLSSQLKNIHRLIVTSATYRQSSAHNEAAAAIDESNRYLWRMNRRRLEAEEIRDSILAVSGRLRRSMGGPGYYLFALEQTAHSPHYEYHKFDPEDVASHRRSVYRFIVRSQPDPYMTTLDCADSSQSTPLRDETLTSLQALSLLNNRFNLSMSRHFARRLQAESQTSPDRIDLAMRLIAGRSPTDRERAEFTAYAEKHGFDNLCRVLFNLSEFVFVD
jgi:Skp family chaperone for outer membrane proteins